MEDGFYADTLRLFNHSIEIQEQSRVAKLLYEQLCIARRIADPADTSCYNYLIGQADRLVCYFDVMSEVVEKMSIELEQLSLHIDAMFRENYYKK